MRATLRHLRDDVQFAEPVDDGGFVRLRLEERDVPLGHVLHVPQPVVDEPERLALPCRPDAAAAVVADDDDVLDMQHVHGVLQHRQAVEIGVDDDVGHVAVDEQLAGQQVDDLVGGYAAVGAADPEVAGILLCGEFAEEVRVLRVDAFGPEAVLFDQVL